MALYCLSSLHINLHLSWFFDFQELFVVLLQTLCGVIAKQIKYALPNEIVNLISSHDDSLIGSTTQENNYKSADFVPLLFYLWFIVSSYFHVH